MTLPKLSLLQNTGSFFKLAAQQFPAFVTHAQLAELSSREAREQREELFNGWDFVLT